MLISAGSLVTPAAAAPVRNASATGPKARNCFSWTVLGSRCPAGCVGPGSAVVLIEDAGLTRSDQGVLGMELAGQRLDDLQGLVTFVDQQRHGAPDQLVGHRVTR